MKRVLSNISVHHNAEIAHRLSKLPGKCQRIHGHSLHIELTIFGNVNEDGILAGLDFAAVKAAFRKYIDSEWDHHLHLNENDPWAIPLHHDEDTVGRLLPGLITHEADPTTENIALWIADWAEASFGHVPGVTNMLVNVRETNTNGAGCAVVEVPDEEE